MKFTIEYGVFLDMLKQVGKKPPYKKRGEADVKILACAAQVFVQSNDTAVGVDAQVSEDGQCVVERKPFVAVLKTFSKKDQLTVVVDSGHLQIDNFSMSVRDCLPQAAVPANVVPIVKGR